MKFSISQGELQNALGIVLKGAATHSTLPVLAGVHIQTGVDKVVFQTTDTDRSIECTVPALVEEDGAIVVPAKLFTDIAKSLPDAAVHFEASPQGATIICAQSTFSIQTIPAEDFPGFPVIDVNQSIEIPFDRFATMVKRVARVVSRDETRAILTGVLVTVVDGGLRLVATDSYRLSLSNDASITGLGDFSAVISGSFLQEIAALQATSAPLSISLSDNQIMVKYQDIVYVNRRLEGNFPNYNMLLPNGWSTRVTFDTKELLAAVKRISLMNNQSSPVKFDVNIPSQTVLLSSISKENGSAQEMLRVQVEGEDVEIAFNAGFVVDAISAIPSDTCYLDIQGVGRPGIFRATGEEDYLNLIMPVRLT